MIDATTLRFDYQPFDSPLVTRLKHSDGSITEIVKRGRMRAVCDTTEGPFFLAWACEHEDLLEMYETEPVLRDRVIAELEAAYLSAHGAE